MKAGTTSQPHQLHWVIQRAASLVVTFCPTHAAFCRGESALGASPSLLDTGQPTWVSIAQFYEEEDSGSSRSSSRWACVAVVGVSESTCHLLCAELMFPDARFACRSSSRGSLRSDRLSVTNGTDSIIHARWRKQACFATSIALYTQLLLSAFLCLSRLTFFVSINCEAICSLHHIPKRAQVRVCFIWFTDDYSISCYICVFV